MSTKNFRISQDNRSRLCMLPSPETIGSCCDFDRDGTSTWAFVHGWIISLEAGEPTHRPTWWSVVSERQILTEHGPSRPCWAATLHELGAVVIAHGEPETLTEHGPSRPCWATRTRCGGDRSLTASLRPSPSTGPAARAATGTHTNSEIHLSLRNNSKSF